MTKTKKRRAPKRGRAAKQRCPGCGEQTLRTGGTIEQQWQACGKCGYFRELAD